MLDQAEKLPASGADVKTELKAVQRELAGLQQRIKEAGLPVIVLFEGWSAAGKGRAIGKLISELDPRGYQVYSNTAPEPGEARRPYLWRYWRDLPARGQIAVLDRGWYRQAVASARDQPQQAETLISSLNTFERQLCDDGYLILKFFLHIGKATQRERLEKLASSKATAWRVTRQDWEQNRTYGDLMEHLDHLMEATNPDWAPWHIVWNEGKNDGILAVLRTIRDRITAALSQGTQGVPWVPRARLLAPFSPPLLPMPKLSEVDLSPALDADGYDESLRRERRKLRKLHSQLYREKVPVVICFEGWDAAGKGGAIRRLSWALDPRGFDVIPIAAPSPDELAHHYLWRFWRQIPKDGHVAIFDRSWYGRVMVERVEGFTPETRWQMGYGEINEFEQTLHRWGAVVLKFWLQIDQETQLARFTERQNTPEKQYKITEEDWRNRAKWPAYELAVDEMLQKTSTGYAPWIIVEGNDKKYARLKVLKTVRQALEARLE